MARLETFLRVKGIAQDGERWIEGWASTGAVDRVGDIVVPTGAVFELPIPLLFSHKHDEPIGSVVRATVTNAGIRIRAKLTAGVARAEEVWKLIQDGALTAVSIGFQSLKQSPLPGGGLRFDSWSWHELSVVSVPANPDAKIAIAKCVAYGAESVARAPEPVAPKVDGAWLRSVEPQRVGETELQAFYRRFDAAVSLLPAEMREHADLHRVMEDKGAMTFSYADYRKFATVDLRTKTVHDPNAPKPKRPAPVAKAPVKAGMTPKEHEALLETMKAVRSMGEDIPEVLGLHLARIKKLEDALADVIDNGFRYRGYWRDGMTAKRGDAFTENGSMWWAVHNTDEKPRHESMDWKIAVRKGRDGT